MQNKSTVVDIFSIDLFRELVAFGLSMELHLQSPFFMKKALSAGNQVFRLLFFTLVFFGLSPVIALFLFSWSLCGVGCLIFRKVRKLLLWISATPVRFG